MSDAGVDSGDRWTMLIQRDVDLSPALMPGQIRSDRQPA